MATLYPTEASMRNAMGGIDFDVSREIAETTRLLNTPGAIVNQQDRLAAQSYVASLTGSKNTAPGVLAANQPYSAPIPGAPDTGDATGGAGTNAGLFPDYTRMGELNDSQLEPGQAQAMGAGGGGSPLEWLKERIGDIGLVVLGVVVVGVALVAASKSNQKMVIQAVKEAVVT